MNKVTKGALAAAAAGALLLGGAGTYATWSDKRTIEANMVETGHLDLLELTSTGWLYENAANKPYEGAIIPGDTLINTYTVTIDAEGDNLTGTLTLTGLRESLEGDIKVNIAGGAANGVAAVPGKPGVYTFAAEGKHTLDVEVTVAFSKSATGLENESVNLNAVTLDLTQGIAPAGV